MGWEKADVPVFYLYMWSPRLLTRSPRIASTALAAADETCLRLSHRLLAADLTAAIADAVLRESYTRVC